MIEYQPKPSYQMENDQKSRKNIYLYYFGCAIYAGK